MMAPFNLLGMTAAALLLFQKVEAGPELSACATGSRGSENWQTGIGDCAGGDVFLKSTLIEVGIHTTGSYGTSRRAPIDYQSRQYDHPYNNNIDGNAGFIADYDRNGWSSGSPAFSGDYFIPGSPVEGWVAEWTDGGNFATVNKGLVGGSAMSDTAIEVTSHGNKQSSFWVGKSGNLQISKVTQFSDTGDRSTDDLYFSTSVTLKNTGSSTMTNIYYMRTVDPDQEQPFTGNYATRNWVDSQRFVDGETPADRADGTDANKCFVAAHGNTYSALYAGLGSINSHCRVNHWGFNNNDASDSWSNTAWQGSSSTNKRNADEAINLMFKYDSIEPGATVQFNYAYVLGADALTPAMEDLEYVTILSPTDIVSGNYVLFTATILEAAVTGTEVSSVEFSIYADKKTGGRNWYTIETKTGLGGVFNYKTTFDSTLYNEGMGQLKAKYTLANGEIYDQQLVVEVTDGVAMCWDPGMDGTGDAADTVTSPYPFTMGEDNKMQIVPCNPSDSSLINEVAFYRVIVLAGEVIEQRLASDSSSPYTVDPFNIDDLIVGLDLVLTAKVTQNDGKVVSYALPCEVAEQNYPPNDISFIQTSNIDEQVAASGTSVVGQLSATDPNEATSLANPQFTFVGGTGASPDVTTDGLFQLSAEGSLTYASNLDFETVFPGSAAASGTKTITVRATDGGGLYRDESFTLTINNINEPPSSVDQTTLTVNEDKTTDPSSNANVIHTFAVTDPDVGNTHSCSLAGGAPYFDVDPSSCALKLTSALNYEEQKSHTFTLIVSDNGSPTAQNQFGITVTVTDVNEDPTAIKMTAVSSGGVATCDTAGNVCTMAENEAVDSKVADLRAVDPECSTSIPCSGDDCLASDGSCPRLSDSLSFAITNDPNNLFKIVSGNQLQIANNVDYESLLSGSVTIRIRATDGVGHQYSADMTLIITDVSEPPSVNSLTCFVDEDVDNGQIAGTTLSGAICMVDATAAGDEELAYSIVNDNGSVADDYFTVQDCSGIIFVNTELLNFESGTTQYVFQVLVEGSATVTATVTINLNNVNEPPVFNDVPDITVDELLGYDEDTDAFSATAISGSQAKIASAVDDPDTETDDADLTFLIIAGNDGNKFSIGSDGTISVVAPLDFEVTEQYVLTVEARDPGSLFDTSTVTITVNPINEKPRFATYAGVFAEVYEPGAVSGAETDDVIGSLILASDPDGVVLAVDGSTNLPDTKDTLTYSILSVTNGGSSGFKLGTKVVDDNLNDAQVINVLVDDPSIFDFEDNSKNTFAITLRVSDGSDGSDGAKTDDVTLTVQIKDSNEAPALISGSSITRTIAECNDCAGSDLSQGTTAIADLFADPEGHGFTYSFTNPPTHDGGRFIINRVTGVITTAFSTVDFEYSTPGGVHQFQYTYDIQVTDSLGASSSTQITITVTDVPEEPTIAAYGGAIDENSGANFLVGTDNVGTTMFITVQDQDIDGTDTVTLAIQSVNGATDSATLNKWTLVSTGTTNEYNLRSVDDLNYEAQDTYSFTLIATDSGTSTGATGALSTTANFEVDVENVNDTPTLVSGTCNLSRKAEAGTTACTIVASDDDSSSNTDGWGTIYYALSGATGAGDGRSSDIFEIVEATGEIRSTTALTSAYEEDIITVTIVARDISGTGISSTATTFAITITPENDQPICGSLGPLTIDEFVSGSWSAGQVVGAIKGSGLIEDIDDSPASLEITITAGNSAGRFAVSGNNIVTTSEILDFETSTGGQSTYQLNLHVLETEIDNPLTNDCTVTINVNDKDEPTTFDNVALDVDESTVAGQVLTHNGFDVAAVQAVDVDACDSSEGTPTYAIFGTEPDLSPIEINSATGVLSLKSGMELDYESVTSYTYNVRWTSGATCAGNSNPNTATSVVTLNVANIPESPSVSANTLSMNEGHVGNVGYVLATDPDFGNAINGRVEQCQDDCALKYSIVSVQDGFDGYFEIDENNGMLTSTAAASSADFETTASITLSVRVVDESGFGTSDTGNVLVNLNDVNDCVVTGTFDDSTTGSSVFITDGGEDLYITGTSLYPTTTRTNSNNDNDITVSVEMQDATVGASQRKYTLANCAPCRISECTTAVGSSSNDIVKCDSVEGVGGPFGAAVTINSVYSTGTTTCVTTVDFSGGASSIPVMNYENPAITAVTNADDMPTRGETMVTIDGNNFGPVGTVVYATYSNGDYSYTTGACTYVTAHQSVTCVTQAGVGAGHSWTLNVAGLNSNAFGTASEYAKPNIDTVQVRNLDTNEMVRTSGGDKIDIYGSNFGNDLGGYLVEYGSDAQFTAGEQYTATGCVAVVTDSDDGHTLIRCNTVAGVGADLKYFITVGGQTSVCGGDGETACRTTSYHIPVITGVRGPGTYRASSSGGQVIYLDGEHFGPQHPQDDYSYVTVTYGPTGAEYTADACVISTAHYLITCNTGPGTGKGHIWKVVIGGEGSVATGGRESLTYLKPASIQVPEGGTNYAPPIVAYYEGLGTKYSQIGTSNVYGDTRGNQQITVLGRNFGSDLSKITSVTYKSEFGEIFTAHPNAAAGMGCIIAIEHTTLHCQTVEGAGDEMTWSVTVDSQESEAPTSGYVAPVITSLEGPGADDASNYGGESITINGDYFGPSTADATGSLGYSDDFLDWVRYGATEATQYTAENCMVESHEKIVCETAQGVGANLYWSASIAGQETASSDMISSYAEPVLNELNPNVFPTDGGVQIEVTGSNLGTFQKPTITFGDLTIDVSDILLGGRNDLLFFNLPEGKGTNRAVQLNVGGQMTNTVYFNYEAPQITSVHSVASDVAGEVKIIILGRSFSTQPVVQMLNNEDDFDCAGCTLDCDWIGHSEVHCFTNRQSGWLYVSVDDRTSSPGYEYFNGDPVVLWTGLLDGDVAATNGGSTLEILCQYCQDNVAELRVQIGNSHASEMRVCVMTNSEFYQVSSTDDNAPGERDGYDVLADRISQAVALDPKIVFNDAAGEYIQRLVCETPEGQDKDQDVIIERLNLGDGTGDPQVIVESLGCFTEFCSVCSTAPCFDYLPPVLSGQTGGLNDVTGGGKTITFTGSNFGLTPSVMYGGYEMTIVSNTHEQIEASVAVGVGKDRAIQIVVGTQSHAENDVFTFAYDPPTFTDLDMITKGVAPNEEGVDTTGLVGVTIEGTNFGVATINDYPGPILFIGTDRITVSSYTHTSLTFDMPAGQGANLPIEIQVKGQNSTGEDMFSYNPPVITSATSTSGGMALETDTIGGKVSGEQITLQGSNFGVRDKSWSIMLMGENEGDSDIEVTDDDIWSWSHEQIIFFVPEGQGRNKALVVTVGGQEAAVPEAGGVQCPPDNADRTVVACFNYSPPDLWSIVEGYSGDTAGGFDITLTGQSFGIGGAVVVIGDPEYDATNIHPINRYRMPPTDCEIVSQYHTEVVCTAPPGWGSLLDVTLTVEGRSDSLIAADGTGKNETFSYAKPVVQFVIGNKGGDASGGEEIKVYGDNFGPQATSVIMKIGNETCENAYWTNDDPLFKRNGVNIPYVKCALSPRATVGPKNVTLEVAFSEADVFERWSPECKIGYYGDNDEYCAECGESIMTGYVCEEDGLTLPYAEQGWWRIMQEVNVGGLSTGAQKCHEEMVTGTRDECPTMWPCMPGFACLGNNTCEVMYDPESERCSDCNEGFFKLNGLCAKCPDKPWVIALGIAIAGGTAAYIGSKLDKKKVNLGIITIGVDYFQVLAIFSSANVDWPSELVDLYNILSAFNLNIDLAAPECWQGADFTYDQKWMVVEITPIALLGVALIAYVIKYMFKRFKGRKARLHSHAPKLFGTVITIMYYTYLYVTTKTLSVFNCQPTTPSDGFQYMTEVGTGDGICYEEDSMQQKLEPWAYCTFALYTLGFPVFCGVLLYVNRMTCFLDQVMKAAKKNDEELKACGTYKFRKMWHRLYHYYKPQYFYWILLVLFRKFMIALTSLVFRGNTLFMLSMTLLVIIVSYALQIKYSPYMSTAEYAEIVDKNSAMMDSVTSEKLMQLKVLQQQSNRSKAAKLGRESLINLKPDIQLSFLHNYNTVESSLLFSAVLVNLSGIMFESGQLAGVYKKSLTYFIISLVSGSLFYFMWVLLTELWVAFYPDKPFLGMPCLNLGSETNEEEGARIRESSMVFDSNPMANAQNFGLSDEDGKKMEYLEKELNKMWANVAEKDRLIKSQQEEIRNLKKGTGVSKFQGLAGNVISMNKKKKQFGNVDKRSTKTIGSLGNSVASLGGSGKGIGGGNLNPMMAASGNDDGGEKKDVGGVGGVGDNQL